MFIAQAEKIAHVLLDIKAVKVSVDPPFTWNTGLRSPIYCDNRLLISYPNERKEVVSGFKHLIEEHHIEFNVIAGTATAGIPWAAFLAWELHKPLVYVRAQPKDYGAGKQVEGHMSKDARVLVVEDLISTGRSSLTSVAACQREYDATVVGVMAIFNYEMSKAKQAFAEANIPWFALSNFTTLLQVAAQQHYLNDAQRDSALSWSSDPQAWHDTHL